MVIIFNWYAILQGIILGALYAILYYLNIDGLFAYLEVTEGTGRALLCYPAFFIVSAMDINGIKGRLFFIPTWIILLFIPLVAISAYHGAGLYWCSRILSPLLFLYFIIRQNRRFNANFKKAKVALHEMQHLPTETAEERRKFWALASHAYIKPSWFYLYGNPVFSTIFQNSPTLDEFAAHYRRLIPIIQPQVRDQDQLYKLRGFELQLSHEKYKHNAGYLENIAEIIDAKNKALQ
ncbi:hypothetical protein ACLI09_06185 [Flavobacterium sp. RHBU_24]|uniref:hypothetical protein n=1 Tax=Flavobacterium sp. RHBU_24 TaxID=3391185 RepID=UPI003984EDB6